MKVNYFSGKFIITKVFVIFTLIFSFLAQLGYSQTVNWNKNGEIEDTQIIVEKERDLTLPKANRNYEKIFYNAPDAKPDSVSHKFKTIGFSLEPIKPGLRVKMYPEIPEQVLPGAYVKVGIGNYGSLLGEGYYSNKASKNLNFSAIYRHLSHQSGPVDNGNSAQSYNHIKFAGELTKKDFTMYSDVFFKRNVFRYYGYPESVEANKDSIKFPLMTFGLNYGIESIDADKNLGYKADVGLSRILLQNDGGETNIDFDAEVHYKISDVLTFSTNITTYAGLLTDSLSQNRVMFGFEPFVTYQYDELQIKAGVNIATENDTLPDAKGFHLYPKLEASYPVMFNTLVAYGSLTGGLRPVTLLTSIEQNPWLARNQNFAHTNEQINLKIGGRGQLSPKFNYDLFLNYKSVQFLQVFLNTTSDQSRFMAVYDNGNTNITGIGAGLSYVEPQKFVIDFGFSYNNYAVDNLDEAYHLPQITSNLKIDYNIRQKVSIQVEGNYRDAVLALNPTDLSAQELTPIFDLDLGATYKLSDKFDIFAKVDNVFNQKTAFYLFYPQRGILVMVGASFTL